MLWGFRKERYLVKKIRKTFTYVVWKGPFKYR